MADNKASAKKLNAVDKTFKSGLNITAIRRFTTVTSVGGEMLKPDLQTGEWHE
jgi:hypothetical protein